MSIVVHYAPQTRAVTTIWALEELGIPYERARYDVQKGEHRTEAFKKLNPNAKVPTVVFDGTPMFESLAILLYLGERYGVDNKLFPGPAEPARIEALSWATWATVTLGADATRFIEASHERVPKERHNAAQAAAARADIEKDLGILEGRLDGRAFILGDAFSLADVMLGSALNYASRINAVDLARFPRVKAYFERLNARPAFGRAMGA
jgi:glutathione S-transferase